MRDKVDGAFYEPLWPALGVQAILCGFCKYWYGCTVKSSPRVHNNK